MRSIKKLMTLVLVSALILSTLAIPTAAVNTDENINVGTNPIKAEYLLDESFSFTSLPGNLPQVFGGSYLPSGWDVQAAGGVLTGGYYSAFKITDSSIILPVTMKKKFVSQSSGEITLEYRFKTGSPAIDGIKWQLLSDSTVGLSIYTSAEKNAATGNIYVDTADSPILIQAFSANTEYGVKAVVDITENLADIYINGVLKASDIPFKNTVTSLDNFSVSTGAASTGDLTLYPIKIYKGYMINERFITTLANLPKDWTANASGGVIVTEDMKAAPLPDIYGLKMDAANSTGSMSFKKSILPQAGPLVFEYKALYPQKTDGLSAELLYGNTAAFKLVTSGGKFCYIDGDGQEVPVYDYIANLWYSIKIKLDTEALKADIYINNKLIKQGADFAAEVPAVDGISFSTDALKKGMVKLDDILLYQDLPLPQDYVPAPVTVSTGDTLVGVQSCSMWREGTHWGWDRINPYKDRTPLLGYYDEGNPEEADWEIKWMAEHGIAFEMFCWFRSGYNKGYPIKNSELDSALLNGYMNAQYSDQVKFMIQWESGNGNVSGREDFRNNIVPYWMEYFIKDPRYLTIDNKPVISIYNYSKIRDPLGGAAGVKAELDYLRNECIKSGFDGAIFLTCHSGTDSSLMREFKEAGFDDFYAYTWGNISGAPENQAAKLLQQKAAAEASIPGGTPIDLIPVISQGRDDEPWGGEIGYATTAEEFQQAAQWVKDSFMPTLPASSLGRKMLLLDNWNEYGEGHYILPANKQGFGYLDAIRNVFGDGGNHQDVIPTQNQKDRIAVLYPQDRVLRQKTPAMVPDHTGSYTMQWEFNTDGDYEGWDIKTQQVSLNVTEGKLSATSSGTDPWMESPRNLGFNGNDNQYIHIRMKNNALDITGAIYFTTEAEPQWTQNKSVRFTPFPNDSGYRDYYIDMSTNPSWTGTINQFRVDPIASKGSVDIDFIRVEYSPAQGVRTYFNGYMTKMTDPIKVIDGCAMVPMEEVYTRLLSLPRQWNDSHDELLAVKGGITYRLTLNQPVAYKNETVAINLEHEPVIEDGLLYAPASFLKQAFGFIVSWDEQNQELSIYTSEVSWNFNAMDRWTYNGQISDAAVSNGYLLGTSLGTGADGEEGYITSPDKLSIEAADLNRIRVNYMNSSPGNELKLYFTTSSDPYWDSDKMIILPAVVSDDSYREYIFDTSSFENWRGVIKQIRLVPTNAAGAFGIDYIKLDITGPLAVLGDNLITDSDMEAGDATQVNGWKTEREYYSDPENPAFAHSGCKVIKVTKQDVYGSIRFETNRQVKGQEYYYSAWAKLAPDSVSRNNPPLVRIYIQYSVDGAGVPAKQIAYSTALSTTEWKQVKGTYTVNEPGNVTGISIYLTTDAPSALDVFYLDDVEIRPVTYTESPAWVYVSEISLNKDYINIPQGTYEKLTAEVQPSYAVNTSVVWTSDNPAVATVDAYGYVYGKGVGKANISATTQEGGHTAVCEVVVGTDNTPPVTTPEISGSLTNGWYTSEVAISLNASDDLSGAGITEYMIGDETEWITYTAPIIVSEDGMYQLKYRSVDKAQNEEEVKELAIKVDRTSPVIEYTAEGALRDDGTYNSHVVVTLLSDDSSGSGVAETVYSMDGASWFEYTIPLTLTDNGLYSISCKAADNAGNTGGIETIIINIAMEPDVMTLYLINSVKSMNLDKGIENSLISKLNNVLKSIQNNKHSSVNQLNAFKNQVNAQSGKKLTVEQANELIESADEIIAVLAE